MKFENKVAIITGSTRGIGRATAELFAKEGKAAHALIPKICASFSAQTYQFHLPEALSRGEGNLRHHGMLKPLGTAPFPKGASAYLGLALE